MNNTKSNILHQVAARYICGKPVELSLGGNGIQLECFQELLETSKCLKESLDNENNLDKVKNLLEKKKQLTKKFQNLTGITWRL
tara:strand:+ start:64 stop:315 length:252 start_codon:yes stop_codon:yes gene_type:complete